MASTVTMTGAEFDALPYEDGRRWELIEGELLAVSSPTPEHQLVVQKLLFVLMLYFGKRPGGIVLADVEFALSDANRVRPDVLVLLGERAATLNRSRVPIPGAPDIAVEVISPSERTSESMRKVETYLRHGAREVWQVFPTLRQVVVYTTRESRRLASPETLTTSLLPDFALAISSLFEN
ncbi:MAG: Uma2 family endonuclease [Bryobacteraceae bacterium]|jgi:Uma2 family endonuclease